jgi:hypothetical protein
VERKVLKAVVVAAIGIGIGLASAAPANAAKPSGPPDNWGQEVKDCNQTACYPGGTHRGQYVRGQAHDSETPGYAREIHELANPGQADPPPFQ